MDLNPEVHHVSPRMVTGEHADNHRLADGAV